MKLAPYLKYRPSGMEWLGDVPEHWEISRLGRITKARCDGPFGSGLKAEHYSDTGVRVVRLQNIRFARFDDSDKAYIDPIYYQQLGDHDVNPGDLLIAGLGDDSNPVGRACVAPLALGPALVKADCFRFRVDTQKADPSYLAFLLSVEAMALRGAQATGTTRSRMNLSVTAGRSITLPPLPEQRAIANFLDRETARFAALVAKKRTLIERLEEKRAALISRTVTRGLPPDAARVAGLDPHPKLKCSGIDWLGVVPEHWEMKQFRYLVRRLDQGWSPVATNQPASEGDWGVLKLSAVRGGRFFPGKNKALQDEPEEASVATPQANDLLISRANTPDRVGDVALVLAEEPRLLIPDLLYRAKLSASVAEPAFVCYFLLSGGGRAQIEADARGSSGSMVKLGQSHIRAWFIPFPPRAEQLAIVTYLNQETARIDTLTAKVEAALERIREYRAALITAAVTGKVDVRAEVP